MICDPFFSTANSDYESKTCVVIIPAEMLSGVCIVDLFDDSTIEDPEHFKATLTIPGGQPDVIPGDPDVAFVTIVDNGMVMSHNYINSTASKIIYCNLYCIDHIF